MFLNLVFYFTNIVLLSEKIQASIDLYRLRLLQKTVSPELTAIQMFLNYMVRAKGKDVLLSEKFQASIDLYRLLLLQKTVSPELTSIQMFLNYMVRAKENWCLRICAKYKDADLSRACVKSHPGICFPFIYSVVSNESVSGQRRPWSDCADAQADLGLCCPHMPEGTFSHGGLNIQTP